MRGQLSNRGDVREAALGATWTKRVIECQVTWLGLFNAPSNDNGFPITFTDRNNVERAHQIAFPHARGKRSLSTRQAGIEMRAAERAHLARGLPLTSLPFSGSNVPEAIELLDASGSVAQTLMLSTNQVGSVQLVTDASTGEVVQRIEYDEFGWVLADSAPGMQPFGFAGGLYDLATNLVRFGARDYAADVGRWIR